MRVYDKRKEEIITYKQDVSDEILAKRDYILPVERIVNGYPNTEEAPEEAGIFVEEDKVREVINKPYHVKTLDEEKEYKINALKEYVSPKFPALFKQINAMDGEYSDEENTAILKSKSDWRKYIDNFEEQINACETIDEIKAIDYVLEEDKIPVEE